MAPKRQSLAGQAAIAVALFFGFYVLALALATILIYLPYAEYMYADRLPLHLVLPCLVGAGLILYVVIPRPDRFEPPGPHLRPARHPQLFEAITDIAERTGQQVPADVYLIPEVTVWVTERGGFLGIGSRTVMGIGLPLLRALNVSEFKAVLAHEFGHYSSGDTSLGPWVYRTRAAIERSVLQLGGRNTLLQAPFLWFARTFLKMTRDVARRQEFVADEIAACKLGSATIAGALKAVELQRPAFATYWEREVTPVLACGFIPPIPEGFRAYLQSEANRIDPEATLRERRPDDPVTDSHPTMPERLASLERYETPVTASEDEPAFSLLNPADDMDTRLLTTLFGHERVAQMTRISWDEVGRKVYVPAWRDMARQVLLTARSREPEFLYEAVLDPTGMVSAGRPSLEQMSPEDSAALIRYQLGALLATLLVETGWRPSVQPGREPEFMRGSETLRPFGLLDRVHEREIEREAFLDILTRAGIHAGKIQQLCETSPRPAATT